MGTRAGEAEKVMMVAMVVIVIITVAAASGAVTTDQVPGQALHILHVTLT